MTAAGSDGTTTRSRAAHNVLAVTVPAIRDNVRYLRQLVVAFAAAHGASAERQSDVALALSEAITNAVKHGYGSELSGEIYVVADYDDAAVEVVVADDGRGMAADVPSDGLGLGLGLIASSTARFTVRDRAEGGTEVWMRFDL